MNTMDIVVKWQFENTRLQHFLKKNGHKKRRIQCCLSDIFQTGDATLHYKIDYEIMEEKIHSIGSWTLLSTHKRSLIISLSIWRRLLWFEFFFHCFSFFLANCTSKFDQNVVTFLNPTIFRMNKCRKKLILIQKSRNTWNENSIKCEWWKKSETSTRYSDTHAITHNFHTFNSWWKKLQWNQMKEKAATAIVHVEASTKNSIHNMHIVGLESCWSVLLSHAEASEERKKMSNYFHAKQYTQS